MLYAVGEIDFVVVVNVFVCKCWTLRSFHNNIVIMNVNLLAVMNFILLIYMPLCTIDF